MKATPRGFVTLDERHEGPLRTGRFLDAATGEVLELAQPTPGTGASEAEARAAAARALRLTHTSPKRPSPRVLEVVEARREGGELGVRFDERGPVAWLTFGADGAARTLEVELR